MITRDVNQASSTQQAAGRGNRSADKRSPATDRSESA